MPKPEGKDRETLNKLTSMAVMLVMLDAMQNGKSPTEAADEIAEQVTQLVESTLESADKEITRLRAEVAEKNKVIAGLIKSNDEYADSLAAKVAIIRGYREQADAK